MAQAVFRGQKKTRNPGSCLRKGRRVTLDPPGAGAKVCWAEIPQAEQRAWTKAER